VSEFPYAVAPIMGLLAATPVAGFPLVNGTPAIITWTAPNDGQLHRVLVVANADVTVITVGGAVGIGLTLPDGTVVANSIFPATQAVGHLNIGGAGNATFPVKPGSTVTLSQTSALTSGAEVVWAELWGS
jgi:hypothetical protein